MSKLLSTENNFYNFKIIDNSSDFLQENTNENDLVVSYYVCNGELKFNYKNESVKILEDQVVIISSANNLSDIEISTDTKVFEISSIKTTKEVIEISDNNGHRVENIISDFNFIIFQINI